MYSYIMTYIHNDLYYCDECEIGGWEPDICTKEGHKVKHIGDVWNRDDKNEA